MNEKKKKKNRSSCRNVVNSLLKKKNYQNSLSNKSLFFIAQHLTRWQRIFLRKIYFINLYTSRLCIVNFINGISRESKNNFVNSITKNILPNILFVLISMYVAQRSKFHPSSLPSRTKLEKLVQTLHRSFKKQFIYLKRMMKLQISQF